MPDAAARSLATRARLQCEVCGGPCTPAGQATSAVDRRRYLLARCEGCGFAFVVAPRTDWEHLYDAAYYAGRGADPSVDYERELAGEPTVRVAEWQGVLAGVSRLQPTCQPWLDFGCGYGTLVRHLRAQGIDAVGYDTGVAAERARSASIPVLDDADLDGAAGRYQVVTAIEVLEHVLDPVGVLRRIAALLAPGGLLFVTTGNAARQRRALARWSYVVPDVHISFYEPRTLATAYRRAGLEPVPAGYGPGSRDVVRAKVLKALGQRAPAAWHDLVPWGLAARLVDARVGVTAQPAARRAPEP